VKRASIPRARARIYLAKAVQFSRNANSALEADLADAALLAAVHAAISAADAIAVALGEERSTDADHMRAADLLEEKAGSEHEASGHVRQLRLLVGKKNLVEYEARHATPAEAREGVERAARLVAWAQRIVDRANV